MQCYIPECGQHVVFHIAEINNRRIAKDIYSCDAHGREFLDLYRSEGRLGAGLLGQFPGTVCLDVELLLIAESQIHHVFLREVLGSRLLGLQLGHFEISALHRAMKGPPAPRPMTHQAMASIIEKLSGKVEHIALNQWDEKGQFYCATLRIRQGDRLVEIDLRPSDAFSLAVQCNVPILLSEHLLPRLASN
jgi:uncharacterized protein